MPDLLLLVLGDKRPLWHAIVEIVSRDILMCILDSLVENKLIDISLPVVDCVLLFLLEVFQNILALFLYFLLITLYLVILLQL